MYQHWDIFGILLEVLRSDVPMLGNYWYRNEMIPVKYQEHINVKF